MFDIQNVALKSKMMNKNIYERHQDYQITTDWHTIGCLNKQFAYIDICIYTMIKKEKLVSEFPVTNVLLKGNAADEQ